MNMMEQIWKIRDARGLDAYEKNFLFTVASRGEAGMFCEWSRNSADMSMKKDRYYKTRNLLLEKGLISATLKKHAATNYKINNDVLASWIPVSQNEKELSTEQSILPDRNPHSVTQNGILPDRNPHSVRPEHKKNTKTNTKKNNEEEHDDFAGAPSSNSLNDLEVKDDENTGACGAASNSLNSLITEDSLNSSIEGEGDAAAAPVVSQEGTEKGSSSLPVIAEWRKTAREVELNNAGVQGHSEGKSQRETKAEVELQKQVDYEDSKGRLRQEWNDELFAEALSLMLDSTGWHRTMTKMDTRAYHAYREAGVVLDW